MIPTKAGQVVRFYAPLEDEDPDQSYVVLEIYNGPEWPRAQIIPLNTGLVFPPVNIIQPEELEVIKVFTKDLIGGFYAIITEDCSVIKGHVVTVESNELIPDFTVGPSGVETNLSVTIASTTGGLYSGKLLVS